MLQYFSKNEKLAKTVEALGIVKKCLPIISSSHALYVGTANTEEALLDLVSSLTEVLALSTGDENLQKFNSLVSVGIR